MGNGYGSSPSSSLGLLSSSYEGRAFVPRTGTRQHRTSSIPCKYYNQPGGCASGRHCKFMHGTSGYGCVLPLSLWSGVGVTGSP